MAVETAGTELFALVLVVAGVLAFLAVKTRQPTITAYIVTGLLLGSAGLGLAGKAAMEPLSELGLAFLLFLIGLEIRLEEVKKIFRPVLAIGILQMVFTGAVAYLTVTLLGFTTVEALVIAAATVYSSTAVVVKLLSDRDEVTSLPGKLDVGILLLQDLVVIIAIAALGSGLSGSGLGLKLVEIAAMAGFIGLLSYFSSRYFLPRLFRKVSENRHAFFVHGVAWALAMIMLAGRLGISSEIGAFFAGLALAQIPYSNELKERVRPLTNFFMAVFFISIGLGIAPSSFGLYWLEALLVSVVLMAAKFTSIFLLTDLQKFTPRTSFRAALNMSQTSEFSLVLGGIAVAQGIVGPEILGFLSIVAITTMGASSYLITYSNRIWEKAAPFLERFESGDKKDIEVRGLEDHALVIGYDHLARSLMPVLEEYFDEIVVVDHNPANTRELSASDYEYIYGDFQHQEIRKNAGIGTASLVICFSPDKWVNQRSVQESDATVFLKAENREQAAELYELGAHYVIVKNVLAAEKMSEYLRLYLEDPGLFHREVSGELESIRWGDKDY